MQAAAYQMMAADYLERGDTTTALARANTAIEVSPDADSYLARAKVYARMGRYEEARVDYRQALSLSPGNSEAANGAAEMTRLRDQEQQAEPAEAAADSAQAAAVETGNAEGNDAPVDAGSTGTSQATSDLYAAIDNQNVSQDDLDSLVAKMVQTGDRSPVQPLTRRLQTESDGDVRVRICDVLGDFRDPYPVPVLVALMQQSDSRDPMLTGQLIAALNAIGDARARDSLCNEMCHGDNSSNRNAAQEALFSNRWRACECGGKPEPHPQQARQSEPPAAEAASRHAVVQTAPARKK